MKLEMRGQLRLEQKMKLAPHMIQSMEILQLPIMALQERIEQEINGNPVLETEEPSDPEIDDSSKDQFTDNETEKPQSSETQTEDLESFGRLDNLDDGYRDHIEQSAPLRQQIRRDGPDRKLEALKNTAAGPKSLHEYLTEQWGLVDAEPAVKKAGSIIIDYIDHRGYLTIRLEQLHNKDRYDFTLSDLQNALELVQNLDPTGIGARDLRDCLLIQLRQSSDDMSFEEKLVSEHMDALLENRLPDIAKKMGCSIEAVNSAIEHLSHSTSTSPGLQIGQERNHPITPDVIVEPSDEPLGYSIRLAESSLPRLRINNYYMQLSKDSETGEKTKNFLQNNIRSAQWIMDAIEQRNNTMLKVTRAIVAHQGRFFEKGQHYLRPLPMSKIAEEVGVHIATISRAVAGKYVQCEWGTLPLRKFFSGGTEDTDGNEHSWEAVRAKLQQIVDTEDKSKPLSDDKIRKELGKLGIDNMARRTIAKYRKLLNIPPARLRKKYSSSPKAG